MKRPFVFFNTRKLFVLLAGLLLVPALASADPIAVRGAALANACAACHGPDGRSQGAIPSLDGLSAEYFKKTMQASKNGKPVSPAIHFSISSSSSSSLKESHIGCMDLNSNSGSVSSF